MAWHEAHQPKSGGLWYGPSPEDWEVFLRHAWMRPDQAYLGCSNDTKTGKTMPKIHINNSLSDKIIIYKGNLYSLKKKRDSSNSEISYIEKTNLN